MSEEIGRVPHVRLSVHGPKKMGAALRSLLPFRPENAVLSLSLAPFTRPPPGSLLRALNSS